MESSIKENPFPGLRSFDYSESQLFFGRERNVSDLLKKLSSNHFIAIIGNSGSGKSSLVKAGLLPAVFRGGLDEDVNWMIAQFHPGDSPLKNLAASLIDSKSMSGKDRKADENTFTRVYNFIKNHSRGLVQSLRESLPPGYKILILIDQFEEIFRYGIEVSKEVHDEAKQLVNLIIDTVSQKDVPIYIVITIRSDFLGECTQFEGLPEAINDGHYLVPRMNREQNKAAIAGPAKLAGCNISPQLIQQLLNDLSSNPDQLPILQHALMRTYDVWKAKAHPNDPIDFNHYNEIGKMEMALSSHAEEAFAELTVKQQEISEKFFKALTFLATDNRGIRRPVAVNRLMEICSCSLKELTDCLKPFQVKGRSFVSPSSDFPLTEHSIIDISHESLMRHWERLKNWVYEEGESDEVYRRLCESALLYESGKAALWRDPELQFALEWKEKNIPNKAWSLQYNNFFELGMKFLNQSLDQRNLEKKKEKRRRRFATSFITLFFMSCTILTMWALKEQKTSQSSADDALKQKQIAELQKDTAFQMKKTSEERAEELARKQLLLLQKTKEAEEQTQIAKSNELIANKSVVEKENALKISEEAKIKAQLSEQKAKEQTEKAESEKEQKERYRLRSLAGKMALKAITKSEDKQLQALLALQAYRLNRENGGAEQDPDIYEALRKSLVNLNGSNSHVINLKSEFATFSLSDNNQSLYSGSIDGSVISLNLKGTVPVSNLIRKINDDGINSVCLSTNGRFLASANENRKAKIWDLSNSKPEGRELNGHNGFVKTIAFDSQNKIVATGGDDGFILVWDLENLTNGFIKKLKLSSTVNTLSFCSGSTKIVAGSNDGLLTVWNYSTNEKVSVSCNQSVLSLAYYRNNQSGERIVAGLSTGEIILYELQNLNLILKNKLSDISVRVEKICVNKAGDLLAASGSDKIIRIYSLANLNLKPIILNEQNARIRAITFDGNDNLYASFANLKIQFWESRCSVLAEKACGQLQRNLTNQEWLTYVGPETPYVKTCSEK